MAVMVRLLSKQGNAAGSSTERHRYMTQAIGLERRILASHQHLLGDSHPDTLMAQGSLANLLSYDGQYYEAVAQARLCLAGQRRVLGDDHPIVFATYNLLGDIEVDAGHWSAARAHYESALAGRERLLGVGDAHTIETASRLYEVLRKLSDTSAAMAVRVRYMDPVLAMDPSTLNASMRGERDEVLSKL
jgi:serine/threonine-protein kinase